MIDKVTEKLLTSIKEIDTQIEELNKKKLTLMQQYATDTSYYKIGDIVRIKHIRSGEQYYYGEIVGIRFNEDYNLIVGDFYKYTIIEYDIHKKQRLKRRLWYEPRCMEMVKIKEIYDRVIDL